MALRVGIAGLGRVGRGLLRTNYSQVPGGRFDVCVICDVMAVRQIAYLLAHDSTYGRPPFTVDCADDEVVVGGKKIHYLRVDRRRGLPDEECGALLRSFDLDVFVDATGTAGIADLRRIIEQKIAKKVVCTANVDGCDISLVYGVNENSYDPERHRIITASTCTGNAMVPVAHILERHFGIEYARILTIHPVLSDQRVIDGYHQVSQLGRSYAPSILPVATNVAKSTALVLPSLAGRLDSLSYRVPTAIVSVLDFTAALKRAASREECVELFENYARTSMKGIIHCEHGAWGYEKASIDYMDTEFSSILLMHHLTVNQGRHLGVSIMHDNERGYCCRALDVLDLLSRKGC